MTAKHSDGLATEETAALDGEQTRKSYLTALLDVAFAPVCPMRKGQECIDTSPNTQ